MDSVANVLIFETYSKKMKDVMLLGKYIGSVLEDSLQDYTM